ncbi:OmpA family protein [Endozoicomonas sp. 4G]|uniref:OmpA family protein n=1 Tax=Endozoicomonas sp. 4G TaxID=2872754 RepID=UPI002078EF21|nr:OmpA family protein [Endozoicomonas sp. 4G]
MRFANIVKAAALPAIALWLAGCASTGGQSTSDVETTPEVVTEEVVIETTPVLDPAVQAVIDSGDVQASPEQVEQLLADKTYHFGFDSSKLKESDYKALDVQAAYLNSPEGRGKNIIIQGHTDERGTRTYNLALGERRANAVKSYLVAKGVSPSRIEVISFGFEKPLDPAHNAEAWAKNRRAHIVIN